jgi:radical SAM protein with 4Fe4S-binding SPASM domain
MLTSKKEILKDWLTEINKTVSVKLIASYDPFGRPINHHYKENLEYLSSFVANINVVATKQSLAKIKKGDSLFDYLYANFPVFMDDFLPDAATESMIPSDEEYLDYLLMTENRYPMLLPYGEAIQKLKKNEPNELQFTTFNKCTILPDNEVTNYLWKRHLSEHFEVDVNYDDNSNMLYNFIQTNQCLSCEYFQACPLRCPVSWSWKNRTRSEGCVNARFFDGLKILTV